jgi:hypothetical protein
MVAKWTYGSKNVANVTHWAYSGVGAASLALLTNAADDYVAQMTAQAPLYGASLSTVSATATDLSSDMGLSSESAASGEGTRVGEFIGANMAVLLSYTTARRYRGGHPRTYLPFGTALDVENPQQWADAFVAAVTAAWDDQILAMLDVTGGGQAITSQVQVSYITAGAPRVVPITDQLTFTGADKEIASQRRRDGRH